MCVPGWASAQRGPVARSPAGLSLKQETFSLRGEKMLGELTHAADSAAFVFILCTDLGDVC